MDELGTGFHKRRLSDKGSSLLIRRFAQGDDFGSGDLAGQEMRQLALFDPEELKRDAGQKIRLDLIDPFDPQPREAPAAGKGWWRVTPSTSETDLDPILIGNYFHSLMEFLPKDLTKLSDEAILVIASTVDESSVPSHDLTRLVKEGRRLLSKFYQSELYDILRSAQNIVRELPYYKLEDDKVRIGRPDLLIKSNKGAWLIVDYKTDTFALENLEQQAQQHYHQLNSYKEDLLAIAGISAEIAVYFAQTGELYRFPIPTHGMAARTVSESSI